MNDALRGLDRLLKLCIILLPLTACSLMSSLPLPGVDAPAPASQGKLARCSEILEDFRVTVAGAGVTDAQWSSDPAFPQYRYDRFLASFAAEFQHAGTLDMDRAGAWLALMHARADTGARIEWRNLPDADRQRLRTRWKLAGDDGRDGLLVLRSCQQYLHRDMQSDRRAISNLASRVRVEDEYATLQRVLGMYWLTRMLAASGLEKWQQSMQERIAAAAPVGVELLPAKAELLNPAQLSALMQQAAAANALGVPEPDPSALKQLFRHYAPQLRVAAQTGADSVSTLRWGRDERLETLITRPTGYVLPSWTRWHGESLLQLNYMYWFPRRVETELMDPYAGRLDGIIWRVTLDAQGRVLFYDSIHPCGCYHSVYPVAAGLAARGADAAGEPVLVYRGAPDATRQRIELQITAQDHQIVAVREAQQRTRSARSVLPEALKELGIGQQDRLVYDLRDYNELRSLPLTAGGHRSLFDSDGIVPGTERGERWYLWPMGVPSAGSMRQWGHHATAFTSRRHFDDADLIPRLFVAAP